MKSKRKRSADSQQRIVRAEIKAEFEKIVDGRYRAALKKAKKNGLVSIQSATIHDPIQFKLIATAILNGANDQAHPLGTDNAKRL